MSKFTFKFSALLKYRRHQRDLCLQLVGQVLAEDQQAVARLNAVQQERVEEEGELRSLLGAGRVDVDRSASRRYHIGQLGLQIRMVEEQRQLIAQKLVRARQFLTQADQRVKALEKLEEKHLAEHQHEVERKTSRDLEDAWLAVHALEDRSP